ncbi:MAG: hypothetical protein K2J20_02585, partial [Bacilli bacterium]|nr:hypothetical protein [Bacilli bacterium]
VSITVYHKSNYIMRHPFINKMVFLDDNNQLKEIKSTEDEEYIKNRLKNAINKMKDYKLFIPFINKPYLPLFFKLTYMFASDKDFAEFLKTMWNYMEYPNCSRNISKNEWLQYFEKADKNLLMSKKELKIYNNLPNEVEIYRGVDIHDNVYALSWTLDYEKAKYFSTTFNNKGKVYKITIKKKYIFAYFNAGDESEVIVDYTKIKDNDLVVCCV